MILEPRERLCADICCGLGDDMLVEGKPDVGKISAFISKLLKSIEATHKVVLTAKWTPAICSYSGIYAGEEPIVDMTLNYNPVQVTVEDGKKAILAFAQQWREAQQQIVTPIDFYRTEAVAIKQKR
jgi:hypothetical protein